MRDSYHPLLCAIGALLQVSACGAPGETCVYQGDEELEMGVADDAPARRCAEVAITGVQLSDFSTLAVFEPLRILTVSRSEIASYAGLSGESGIMMIVAQQNTGTDAFDATIRLPQGDAFATAPPDYPEEFQRVAGLSLQGNGFVTASVSSDDKVSLDLAEPNLRSASLSRCRDGSSLHLYGGLADDFRLEAACEIWRVRVTLNDNGSIWSFPHDLAWLFQLPVPRPLARAGPEFIVSLSWRGAPPDAWEDVCSSHFSWMVAEGLSSDAIVSYVSIPADDSDLRVWLESRDGELWRLVEGGEWRPLAGQPL